MQTKSFESYRTQLTFHRKNNTSLCSQNVNFLGNKVQQTGLKCLSNKKLFKVPSKKDEWEYRCRDCIDQDQD